MKKFMLGYRIRFESHAKNVRETGTKVPLKTAKFLLDADEHA